MMNVVISQMFVRPPLPTLDLTGKTVIVTGGNIGLGLEAARHFVALHAKTVILTSRNLIAGEEAVKSISSTTGTTGVIQCWHLDLCSFESVRNFASRAISELDRIDIVIQNAAVGTGKFHLQEGFESSLTVNVISTFYLGFLLIPKMKETSAKFFDSGRPSMTFVVSSIHALYPPKHIALALSQDKNIFEFLSQQQNFSPPWRYADTKLIEVALVREFAKITGDEYPVIINMTNPALCHSALTREAGWWMTVAKFFAARTTEVGARTLVAGASVGVESHGKYIDDGYVRDDCVSGWLTGEKGEERQERIWRDLKSVLDGGDKGLMEAI